MNSHLRKKHTLRKRNYPEEGGAVTEAGGHGKGTQVHYWLIQKDKILAYPAQACRADMTVSCLQKPETQLIQNGR